MVGRKSREKGEADCRARLNRNTNHLLEGPNTQHLGFGIVGSGNT